MVYKLAQSLGDVRDYIAENRIPGEPYYGLDTETTSLNTRIAKLVGWSLSFKEGDAMYVPTMHKIGTNVPMKPSVKLLEDLSNTGAIPVFYNAKYDKNILQVNTGWAPDKFEDALEQVYLGDPDRKRKGLKEIAKTDLDFEMTKFEDLFTPEEQKAKIYDISTKAPARCRDYAAADADATLRAWHKWLPTRKEFDFHVKLDLLLIDVLRKLEHNGGMVLNRQYVHEQLEMLDVRATALREQIHRMVGKQFEIASPKQLGIALFEDLEIPSQGMTRAKKNPIYKTDAETLEKLAEQYPIVGYVISYRKVVKAKDTYFKKLEKLGKLNIPIRFNFNMFAAPTFRFSAPGGDPTKDGATGINIQAVSNGEARDLMAVNIGQVGSVDTYLEDVNKEEIFFDLEKELIPEDFVPYTQKQASTLPWIAPNEDGAEICFRETCVGCPAGCSSRGVDVTRRLQKNISMIPSVRQAFAAPQGFQFASFDYDRQELVIGANLSGEPTWLNALANGVDLHVVSASAAFGISVEDFMKLPAAEFKRKRDIGKTLNFAVFYGATAYTLSRKANISVGQAEIIYNAFVQNHPVLFNWMRKTQAFARKQGYTTTFFGRKRSLAQFYEHWDKKMHSFADRSAVNTCIQGTAAEVTRMAMVKVDKAFKKEVLTSKEVRMVMQLHDELSFLIRDDLLEPISVLIRDKMEFKVKSWQVQLTVGAKVGQVWGQQEDYKFEKAA